MFRLLAILLISSTPPAFALGVPKACRLGTPEINLARECFTGDMHRPGDLGRFFNTQNNHEALNFCLATFVYVQPSAGGTAQLTVFKDDAKAKFHAYTYAMPAPPARAVASNTPLAVSFKNLRAQCFSTDIMNDKCSHGVFGFGDTDVSLTVMLEGQTVKDATTERSIIHDKKRTQTLLPRGEGNLAATDTWLVQIVKQKLLTEMQARRAAPRSPASQFRYCRMAVDGFVRAKKMTDPFSAAEHRDLDAAVATLDGAPSAAPAMVGTPSVKRTKP